MATLPLSGWKPESPDEKNAAHHQLERILGHPVFRNSRRCAGLLRYVVECTLEEKGEQLKERALGIEVFGRIPDYDTNLDPVVRTTAGEVRKRIAQYYHESGHEEEIRIDLPLGSYVPEFHLAGGDAAPLFPVPSGLPPALVLDNLRAFPRQWRIRWGWLAGLGAVAAVLLSVGMIQPWSSGKGWKSFWNPVLSAPGSVLISIGEPHLGPASPTRDSDNMTVGEHTAVGDTVALCDAIAFARVATLLSHAGKTYRARSAGETTLADLRQGSAVLIAGFDNPWTLRLTSPLRFHLASEGSVSWIEDRKTPAQKNWQVDFATPYSKLTQDYALVARLLDPNSGQNVIVAAGIGENGTLAAGEFISDPRYLSQLSSAAEWAGKNLEFVIATQVIDGKSGPPRVEAQYSW